MTDYERYQLEWMIAHGHSLGELMSELDYQQNALEATAGVNLTVSDIFEQWELNHGFGSELYACEEEWRDAEGSLPSAEYGITKDMVRAGIEHGVIRFEANPDPNDPWKTMCCVGEDGGLFYFVDTTDIPPEEYIRMNANNLDMVVDDVWEALNGDILRSFADDYERYADLLRSPHRDGHSSLDVTALDAKKKVAVGVGYVFNLLPASTVAGIALRDSGTSVTVDGVDYPLMQGETFEDSRKIDGLLDIYGERRTSDYRCPAPSLKEEAGRVRQASDALANHGRGVEQVTEHPIRRTVMDAKTEYEELVSLCELAYTQLMNHARQCTNPHSMALYAMAASHLEESDHFMMGLTDEMAQPVLDALAEGGPDARLHAEELIEKIACQQILENDEILADSLDGLVQRFGTGNRYESYSYSLASKVNECRDAQRDCDNGRETERESITGYGDR